MSPSATDLPILVLPALGADLLLPGGAVAEILRGEDLEPPQAGGPDWFSGTLSWRGHRVPVARLADASVPSGRPNALVVCFAPGGTPELPYLAIESPGLPRLERVTPDKLAPELGAPPGTRWFVVTALRLNGRAAWLLDLGALEQGLLG